MNDDQVAMLRTLKYKERFTEKILVQVLGEDSNTNFANMIIENVELNLLTVILDSLQLNNIPIATYIESRFI